MTTLSVAEDTMNLSDLIDRVLRGEGVVVTRHGTPVVEIKAIDADPKTKKDAELEWLRARRVTLKVGSQSASETLAAIRDQY